MFQPIIWWNEGFFGCFLTQGVDSRLLWLACRTRTCAWIWTIPTGNVTYTRLQPTRTRWLANMKYKHSKLWLLGLGFRCIWTPIVAHDLFGRAQGATSINDLCLSLVRFKLIRMKMWKLLEFWGWNLGWSNLWCKSEKRGGLSVTGGVLGLCLLSKFLFLFFSYEICEVFYRYLVHCLHWLFDEQGRI
jgi:hypothetical protein